MKVEKKYVILFSILFIYLAFMLCLWYFSELKKGKDYYLIISPNTIIKHSEGNFETIKNESTIENDKFKVWIENSEVGTYSLKNFKGVWYYVNENGTNNRITKGFVATSNLDMTLAQGQTKEELTNEDLQKITPILDELNIIDERKNTFGEKITIDIDNDQVDETLYTVLYSYKEKNENKQMNLILMSDDNEIKIIDKKTKQTNTFDCTKIINTILDINNDQKYEIITSCTYFDQIGTCHDIYQLKKGKYEKIYKCDDPKSGM